jgi:hypothetical protein
VRSEQEVRDGLKEVEDLLRAYLSHKDHDPNIVGMLTLQAWTLEWVLGRREKLEKRFVPE